MSVPMRFASIVFPDATAPDPERLIPDPQFPEITLRAPESIPPMMLLVEPDEIAMPTVSLQTAPVPAALVPIKLPRMMLLPPLIRIPDAPFPEMRFP